MATHSRREQPVALAQAFSAAGASGGRFRDSLRRSPGAGIKSSSFSSGAFNGAARRIRQRRPTMAKLPTPRTSPIHISTFFADTRARGWGGGPLKISSVTGASVMAPESAMIGAFGSTGSALTGVFSRARTGRGWFETTSFSAPLVAVAGGGFGSLTRWGG